MQINELARFVQEAALTPTNGEKVCTALISALKGGPGPYKDSPSWPIVRRMVKMGDQSKIHIIAFEKKGGAYGLKINDHNGNQIKDIWVVPRNRVKEIEKENSHNIVFPLVGLWVLGKALQRMIGK